ncbi:MAG: 2-phosphosulfolactate phosphatase [Ferruginibacter sp.]|nr:2-phosphosulfolactate phosphatase [Ferruginibacter sp.]
MANPNNKPILFTSLSPALLNLYDINSSIVVIIDILRATSTIATALHNGAKEIIPVDSVPECIRIGKQMGAITAGERDGKVAEGLQHGNSPMEYPSSFISGKTLVLTTTNGTKLLHMALEKGADQIITGAFSNLDIVCDYLLHQKKNVLLACSAWINRINLEDTLFAGAVIHKIGKHFNINCDASNIALSIYKEAGTDLFTYIKEKPASHYLRLSSFGMENDIKYCLLPNTAPILPFYESGRLLKG